MTKRGVKLRKNLEARRKHWDSLPKDVQSATTRPGSEHK